MLLITWVRIKIGFRVILVYLCYKDRLDYMGFQVLRFMCIWIQELATYSNLSFNNEKIISFFFF